MLYIQLPYDHDGPYLNGRFIHFSVAYKKSLLGKVVKLSVLIAVLQNHIQCTKHVCIFFRELCEGGVIVSADDYFMDGDVYCYDQRKLTEAHDQCRKRGNLLMYSFHFINIHV